MNNSANLAQKALEKYIFHEQDFFSRLKQKNFTIAEILPQIEEQCKNISINNCKQLNRYNTLKTVLTQDGYTDISFLGEGQFGTVLSVKKGNKRQAVKGFLSSGNSQLDYKIQLEFENQNKMRDCKYVVQCPGFLRLDQCYFIILEQCLSSLDAVLKVKVPPSNSKVIFSEPTVIKVSYELASGFQFIHSKGTAVRDIKPENIMVNYNLECQISDFGMSKHITQSTKSSICAGNMVFKAPEINQYIIQCDQEGKTIPHDIKNNEQLFIKSDLFSLGLLMCNIILGEEEFSKKLLSITCLQFTSENLVKFIEVVAVKLNSYQSKNTLLPIIKSLISYDPEKRMGSKEVQEKLSPLFNSLGFADIVHITLDQNNSNLVQSTYSSEVELIPSFQNQHILSISQKLQQRYCPNLTHSFIKTCNNGISSEDVVLTETKICFLSDEENQGLQMKKQTSIMDDFASSGSHPKKVKKHQYNSGGSNAKQQKNSSLRNDLKTKCLKVVKEVHHYGQFSISDIEIINVEKLSRRWIYFLLLVIIAISACEIVGDSLELLETATTLSQTNLRYMRIAFQGVQYLSAYVLLMNLFMLNHHQWLPLYSILALLPQAPASTVSLINNFQVFSFDLEFPSKMYYIAIGLQAITAISVLIGLYKAQITHSFKVVFNLLDKPFNFKAYFSKHDIQGLFKKVNDNENGSL